jgi:hypothetical protein
MDDTTQITVKQVLAQALKKASISTRRQSSKKQLQFKPAKKFPKWARENVTLHQMYVPILDCVHRANAIEFMDSAQRKFYETWIRYWKKGKPIDVKGNTSYLFPYTYTLLRKALKNPRDAIYELKLLDRVYKHEKYFYEYLKNWIFDAYVLNKEYWNAIAYIQSRYNDEPRYFTSRVLSLKYKLGVPISGEEVLGLYNRKPRELVLDNLDIIVDQLEQTVRDFEMEHDIDLLSLITEQFAIGPSPYYLLFSGTGILVGAEVDFYDYSSLGDFNIVIDQWMKNAENALREAEGLPKIGEGWVSETMLCRIVIKIFEDYGYEVIHHSYPPFLRRQELDIHIPALNLGIEYMGKQHFEPVDLFGGKDGFKKIVARDKRKKRLCEENGITLIYFRYDEPIEESYVRDKLSGVLTEQFLEL